jgi:hypothetical protein
MRHIDERSDNRPSENGQLDDGLSPLNPSAVDEIVRRGQHAMERRRRGFDDWLDIAEALQVGRVEAMRAAQTNEPKGKRYETVMGEWLLAQSFHAIDKSTRNRLLECLQQRAAIEKWRATLTEGERFRFNHPDSVLPKWKAAAVAPDPNAPRKISAVARLKKVNIELQEKLLRAEHELSLGGGDLWTPDDVPEDIAAVMLVKLSPAKAERVARAILKKRNNKKSSITKTVPSDVARITWEGAS